jgi:hypothetical protein
MGQTWGRRFCWALTVLVAMAITAKNKALKHAEEASLEKDNRARMLSGFLLVLGLSNIFCPNPIEELFQLSRRKAA